MGKLGDSETLLVSKMTLFSERLLSRTKWLCLIALLMTSCVTGSHQSGQAVTVEVERVKKTCGEAARQCLVLRINNQGSTSLNFDIDSEKGKTAIAEPLYSYQGLKKENPVEWNAIALSLGDYIASIEFLTVPPKSDRKVEVFFPGELPTAWRYSKFRVGIRDRSRNQYFSDEFDAHGNKLNNASQKSPCHRSGGLSGCPLF